MMQHNIKTLSMAHQFFRECSSITVRTLPYYNIHLRHLAKIWVQNFHYLVHTSHPENINVGADMDYSKGEGQGESEEISAFSALTFVLDKEPWIQSEH